jgi:hypothetical protein
MDAVYILSPQPHIVDCIMADLERRRYRGTFLVWTSCKAMFSLFAWLNTDLFSTPSTIKRAHRQVIYSKRADSDIQSAGD